MVNPEPRLSLEANYKQVNGCLKWHGLSIDLSLAINEPSPFGLGPLWLPSGQYQGHTTIQEIIKI